MPRVWLLKNNYSSICENINQVSGVEKWGQGGGRGGGLQRLAIGTQLESRPVRWFCIRDASVQKGGDFFF